MPSSWPGGHIAPRHSVRALRYTCRQESACRGGTDLGEEVAQLYRHHLGSLWLPWRLVTSIWVVAVQGVIPEGVVRVPGKKGVVGLRLGVLPSSSSPHGGRRATMGCTPQLIVLLGILWLKVAHGLSLDVFCGGESGWNVDLAQPARGPTAHRFRWVVMQLVCDRLRRLESGEAVSSQPPPGVTSITSQRQPRVHQPQPQPPHVPSTAWTMRRAMTFLSAATLFRHGHGTGYTQCHSSGPNATTQQAVRAAAEAVGAVVADGGFEFWAPPPECVMQVVDCGNANPTSPYAYVTLGGSKGHRVMSWPLAPTQVVAVWLCVPPVARYLGWTPYLMTRFQRGTAYTVFGSLSDTLSAGMTGFPTAADPSNSRNKVFSRLQSAAGPNTLPHGQDAVLLFGASGDALTAAKKLIEPLMAAPGGVNTLLIPSKFSPDGMPGSTYSLFMRYALPADPAAWATWMASPPVSAWSITMPQAQTQSKNDRDGSASALQPRPLISKRGFSEVYLEGAAFALANIVAARLNASGATTAVFDQSKPNPLESGYPCIEALINCGGDNRDTTYMSALPTFVLPLESDSMAVVVGVNHKETGNGVYTNLAVYDSDIRLGVLAPTDAVMDDTALPWLKGTQHERYASQLYVLALSRTCGPSVTALFPTNCIRVPSTGFPSVDPAHQLRCVERPYAAIDGSFVGPDSRNLVLPKLVLVNVQSYAVPTSMAGMTLNQVVNTSLHEIAARRQQAAQAAVGWSLQEQSGSG
jgi:hypothetical protein